MSQAHQQLLLNEESQKYAVINTHRGLFRYNRLPFGISSAPGIFQTVMESILSGIPGIFVYIDDVLVTRKSEEEYLSALEEVLCRIMESGLKTEERQVCISGSICCVSWTSPVAEKVEAVQEAPAPKNASELKSYLGLLTYYSRFLPNLSKAFERSKELLLSLQLLVHFDPNLVIHLA